MTIAQQIVDQNHGDCLQITEGLDDIADSVDQDWEKETTTWIMRDGSAIVASCGVVEARSIAQQISAKLDDDGRKWKTSSGFMLSDLCGVAGGICEREHLTRNHRTLINPARWTFRDGSAIVDMTSCWDIRADGCNGYCAGSAGCDCRARSIAQ